MDDYGDEKDNVGNGSKRVGHEDAENPPKKLAFLSWVVIQILVVLIIIVFYFLVDNPFWPCIYPKVEFELPAPQAQK
ncbi:hypothetical protein BV898_06696 [Hypsibius exemplaris]|uniref:Uncharacterized protein n=1 Tax=Hypsibius exemplaris TaxID=2072580 RepID=A0A1W0WVR1_HYPEX|nr:hypothetical protein BV898_06696 [Hypsibius exemplaris]